MPAEFPGMELVSPDVAYLMGCDRHEQFITTLKTIVDPHRFCGFCERNLDQSNVLFHRPDWVAIRNAFKDTDGVRAQRFLIIPKRHITTQREITCYDAAQAWGLFQDICDHFDIQGGARVARFDNPLYHAGTMKHYHENVICPTGTREVREALCKNWEQRQINWDRLRVHIQLLMERGGFEPLFT